MRFSIVICVALAALVCAHAQPNVKGQPQAAQPQANHPPSPSTDALNDVAKAVRDVASQVSGSKGTPSMDSTE